MKHQPLPVAEDCPSEALTASPLLCFDPMVVSYSISIMCCYFPLCLQPCPVWLQMVFLLLWT